MLEYTAMEYVAIQDVQWGSKAMVVCLLDAKNDDYKLLDFFEYKCLNCVQTHPSKH